MQDSQLIVAPLEDGTYVAASTGAPFFCTVGKSQDAVLRRARAAAEFYLDVISAPQVAPSRVQFTHDRVVPEFTEAWLADRELRTNA